MLDALRFATARAAPSRRPCLPGMGGHPVRSPGLRQLRLGGKSLQLRRHFGVDQLLAPDLPFTHRRWIPTKACSALPVDAPVGSSLGGFFACLNTGPIDPLRLPGSLIVRPLGRLPWSITWVRKGVGATTPCVTVQRVETGFSAGAGQAAARGSPPF